MDSRRFIELRGGVNFRDLGGYAAQDDRRIGWGLVFRSGTTHQLDARDEQRLSDLRIATVIDLRSSRERLRYPNGLAKQPQISYVFSKHDHRSGNLSMMVKDISLGAENMEAEMLNLYRELPYEFSDIYRELFLQLAFGTLPLAFNCAAGKDRTGVAAALLLSALGVSWDDIVLDYMLTERSVAHLMQLLDWPDARLNSGRYNSAAVAVLFGVNARYLEAMKENVIARSGSMNSFLATQLGLETATLEALRQRLLVAK